MSSDRGGSGVVGQIVVAVVVALLAGGTAPWWLDKFFKEPPTPEQPNNLENTPVEDENNQSSPLRVGTYRKNLDMLYVHQESNRICIEIQDSSSMSSVIGSVDIDPGNRNIYRFDGDSARTLHQEDLETIIYLDAPYKIEHPSYSDVPEQSEFVQECLKSNSTFFRLLRPKEEDPENP